MTKSDFLAQLAHKLRVLPEAERRDALDYYEGYISDADSEEAALAQLGTPGEVAAMILAEYMAKDPVPQATAGPYPTTAGHYYPPPRRSGMRNALVIIAALFAVPIGLPIAIGVAMAAFGLFISLVMVVFSLGLGGAIGIIGGIISLITVPFVLFSDSGFALMQAGMGLAAIGMGILMLGAAWKAASGFAWIARFVSKKIMKRGIRHGR
ncbi:MAG: DUF1700 domain-containing protein [Defluviitaleaceae bacterium]|nr:DUF1700 domain-containing protein [Defluviitaleaceae bacterium]